MLATTDVFIHPAPREPRHLAPLEALAAGADRAFDEPQLMHEMLDPGRNDMFPREFNIDEPLSARARVSATLPAA